MFLFIFLVKFFAPAILNDGWVVIHVGHVILSHPCFKSSPQGPTRERKDRHEFVSSRLHDALFDCFNEFFVRWPKRRRSGA